GDGGIEHSPTLSPPPLIRERAPCRSSPIQYSKPNTLPRRPPTRELSWSNAHPHRRIPLLDSRRGHRGRASAHFALHPPRHEDRTAGIGVGARVDIRDRAGNLPGGPARVDVVHDSRRNLHVRIEGASLRSERVTADAATAAHAEQ